MRWSDRILKRDKVCVCGSPSEEAHHIYPKAKWPELRNKDYNGIGLCKDCHKAIYGKEEQHIERFLKVRPAQARTLGTALRYVARNRGIKLGVTLR